MNAHLRLALSVIVPLALSSGCKEAQAPEDTPPAGACAPSDCGPAMGMPVSLCPDGVSKAGPTGNCLRHADGSCGWEVTSCPPDGAASTGGGPAGATCGSRGLPPCPDGQFCDFPKDSACGAADGGGVCKAKPDMCAEIYEPVCGCDGATYPNTCAAARAGVSVSSAGPCS